MKGTETPVFGDKVSADIVSYLKLIIDPKDADQLKRIYNKGILYLKKAQCDWAIKNSKKKNISVYDAVDEQMQYVSKEYKSRGANFRSVMNEATKCGNTFDTIMFICDNGYRDYLKNKGISTYKLDVILFLAKQEPNLMDFIEHVKELNEKIKNGFDTKESNPVILSTIHSSKGREFDVVYMIDLWDGRLPSNDLEMQRKSKDSEDSEQEERRLFYVGMTRAKNKLILLKVKGKPCGYINELFPHYERETVATTHPTNAVIGNIPMYKPAFEVIKNRYISNNRATMEKQKREEQEEIKLEKERKLRMRKESNEDQDILDRMNQQEEPVYDSRGTRWIKCEICGQVKKESAFATHGGVGHINLGKCSQCCRSNKQ